MPLSIAGTPCDGALAGLCAILEEASAKLPATLQMQMQAHAAADAEGKARILRESRIVWVQPDPGAGLADSWSVTMSAFYTALLTDSAFYMDVGGGSSWEWAYTPHAIDWRLTPAASEALLQEAATLSLMQSNKPARQLFRGGDLATLFSGKRVLRVTGIYGLVTRLFNNALLLGRTGSIGTQNADCVWMWDCISQCAYVLKRATRMWLTLFNRWLTLTSPSSASKCDVGVDDRSSVLPPPRTR